MLTGIYKRVFKPKSYLMYDYWLHTSTFSGMDVVFDKNAVNQTQMYNGVLIRYPASLNMRLYAYFKHGKL